MEKLISKSYLFITPLLITIVFYFTKIVNLNSFLDCIVFYAIGIIIFYVSSLLGKKRK
jgi:hypothetical protein